MLPSISVATSDHWLLFLQCSFFSHACAHQSDMAAAVAGSSTALRLKPHSFSSIELNCFKTALISSAESPRTLRTEWSLSLDKVQEPPCSASSVAVLNASSCLELGSLKWDELYDRKKVKLKCNRSRRLVTQTYAISSDSPTHHHGDRAVDGWFNVQDPRVREPPWRGRVFEVNHAWEVLRQDLQFCDWKARSDVLAIRSLHDKVVDVLNPLARDWKSVNTLHEELADLQLLLSKAHEQVHLSESRVTRTLQKLSEMEVLVNDMLLQDRHQVAGLKEQSNSFAAVATVPSATEHAVHHKRSQGLTVAGPLQEFSPALKNFWYPVAFTDDIKEDTMVPFECFEEPWVLFRGQDGRVGCVRNSCAHRACPLHLGEVKDGRIQCPYHGWEYATNGVCEKMPSTKPVKVSIQALPCIEHDDMVWIWPGGSVPDRSLPVLNAPAGYTTHAQIIMELPVEHGLLMENLLDLAHAPFTHTTTFAKGWPVPSLVKFCTPVTALQGYWDPYPIDMEFQPPCMVRSTIGISKPGKLEGNSTQDCAKHLHQLHVCLPSSRGKTRLLYRLSLDFYPFLKHVPYIQALWKHLANKVLDEDLRLVLGQQDRMIKGANVWNLPVSYDKLGVRYRKWRLSVEHQESQPLNSS